MEENAPVIWVRSAKGPSLWHLFKDRSPKNRYNGDQITWTECLCQLSGETVEIPTPPTYTRGQIRPQIYWQQRVCRNCKAYYQDVLNGRS